MHAGSYMRLHDGARAAATISLARRSPACARRSSGGLRIPSGGEANSVRNWMDGVCTACILRGERKFKTEGDAQGTHPDSVLSETLESLSERRSPRSRQRLPSSRQRFPSSRQRLGSPCRELWDLCRELGLELILKMKAGRRAATAQRNACTLLCLERLI